MNLQNIYITCQCGKKAKDNKFKKEGPRKGRIYYTCGYNNRCDFFHLDNQPFITYKDIIEEPCFPIFDIEWDKKYPIGSHVEYEYFVPYFYSTKIRQKGHIAEKIGRRSPFCFIFSSVEYAKFFIDTFNLEWKIAQPNYAIEGVDIINDSGNFCKLVPSLCSWSSFTDNKIFKKECKGVSLAEKKKIGKSYHNSDKKFKNRVEWEKHWVELNATLEHNKGWLWNKKIKYVIFEEETGYFMVRRLDIIDMLKDTNIDSNTSINYYLSNSVYDPRKAYKRPFINPTSSYARYDYKLWFKKEDFKNIKMEWKYKI